MDTYENWSWSGPEEGDVIDTAVVIMFDGVEVMEITGGGTPTGRKNKARQLTKLLNAAKVIPL